MGFLQTVLAADEPQFSQGMAKLELSASHGGVDTRLIADITHTAHAVMRKLGLDPANTTPFELYKSLEATVKHGTAEDMLPEADYVLLAVQGEVISFNLIDAVENYHHELAFENRIVSYGQRALRGEIVKRYLGHPTAPNEVVKGAAEHAGLIVETDKFYRGVNDEVDGKKPSILAIGDIFTDAFIELDQDEARIDTDADGSKRLSLPFGSKPPYKHVDVVQAVGPSPNAAVAFARLGVNTSLLAFLGDDQAGKDSLAYLASEKIDSTLVAVQQNTKSNYYYVLRYGADRTILVHDENYDYKWREPAEVPDWIYLSLISPDSWQLHEDMLDYLERHPEVKLAFQPGTFHFKWGARKLERVYKRSHIIVVNREEAMQITELGYDSIHELANGLHKLGPQIVVITDGPNGSYASYDWKLVRIPNYPDPAPPLDRTGAGDAFASTIVAALALGETMETALCWAPINSMSVVQKIGAQAGLLHREEIASWLEKAPDDYVTTKLEGNE